MPPHLKVEIAIPNTDPVRWEPVGAVRSGDREGLFSDHSTGSRDIYRFGIDPTSNTGYVSKSEGGVEAERPDAKAIHSIGTLTVATLGHGEAHAMELKTESGQSRTVRFTYFEE